MDATKLIKIIIGSSRTWNGGMGLIVPEWVAEELKSLGIEEGYSVSQNLPAQSKEDIKR